jgi:hypothetical protein
MVNEEWKALKVWEGKQVKDAEGDVALCFGLAIDFYFRGGETADKRRAMLECFREYESLCGPSLRWWVVENKALRSVAKLKVRDMSPYLLSTKWETSEAHEEACTFIWHGGERKEDASPIRIEGFGASRFDVEHGGDLSYLRVSFPVTFWADRLEALLRLIGGWSVMLQPVHGYGGVTLIQSMDDGFAQMYEDEEFGLAMRYPGLEIDDPVSTACSTQLGIKGGNWITILGTEYLTKLGEGEGIQSKLGREFAVQAYSGGQLIVAGPCPEIGDRSRDIDTPLLRRLAALLRPIRTPQHWPTQARGKFSDAAAFNAWLARFD